MRIFILILIAFGSFALLSNAIAEQQQFGNGFLVNQDIRLIQLCANCTYNNITSITYPNSSAAVSNKEMTKSGAEFYYIFPGNLATQQGTYTVNGVGDPNGVNKVWAYDIIVGDTPNNFLIFVYLLAGLAFIASFFLMILNIAKIATATETIFGVATSWSVYFLMIFVYWLSNNYTNSSFLIENADWVVLSFGFTNFLLPLFAFIISFIKRGFEKAKPPSVKELTGRAPFMNYG